MRLYTFKVAVGAVFDLTAAGNYIRIRSVTGGSSVNISIQNEDGNEQAELSQGDDCEFTPFSRLRISHDGTVEQVIKLMVAKDRKSGSAQISGSINTQISVGPWMTQKTVTNAAATANNFMPLSARSYLLIQNKSATGSIYLNVNGVATVANGLRLGPGESYEVPAAIRFACGISAIGDIPSNTEVVTIEA